ncbi:hypothetical protein C8J56DRAFT_778154 [Mycena floridula]|nr:hypothetical protein C8J56DRAFT_778154 [Mycena floridula]
MIQCHIEGYQSLLAPIRKMPPEILRVIFEHVCDDSESNILNYVGFYIPLVNSTSRYPRMRMDLVARAVPGNLTMPASSLSLGFKL